MVVMSHQTFHHIGWRGRVSDGKGGGRCGRTYELDEDAYIDVFKGSRQFDPPCRFHAPIAAALSATCPSLCSLFPTMCGDLGESAGEQRPRLRLRSRRGRTARQTTIAQIRQAQIPDLPAAHQSLVCEGAHSKSRDSPLHGYCTGPPPLPNLILKYTLGCGTKLI